MGGLIALALVLLFFLPRRAGHLPAGTETSPFPPEVERLRAQLPSFSPEHVPTDPGTYYFRADDPEEAQGITALAAFHSGCITFCDYSDGIVRLTIMANDPPAEEAQPE